MKDLQVGIAKQSDTTVKEPKFALNGQSKQGVANKGQSKRDVFPTNGYANILTEKIFKNIHENSSSERIDNFNRALHRAIKKEKKAQPVPMVMFLTSTAMLQFEKFLESKFGMKLEEMDPAYFKRSKTGRKLVKDQKLSPDEWNRLSKQERQQFRQEEHLAIEERKLAKEDRKQALEETLEIPVWSSEYESTLSDLMDNISNYVLSKNGVDVSTPQRMSRYLSLIRDKTSRDDAAAKVAAEFDSE